MNHAVPSSNATGGNFSEGYIVEDGHGRRAFLKALDYSRALRAPDPAVALQALTEAFNFERAVLQRCGARHLDKVVTALADGTVRLNAGAPDGGVVQYLIFELADGDVRSQADVSMRFDLAFILRALHHVATGVYQLHGEGIAHQDLKPSNVLVFKTTGESKIGDLGRAAYRGHSPPHESQGVAGDPSYAPPELLYGFIDPDWFRRRLGCDAYLLGSMAVFFFLGQGLTRLIAAELDPSFGWQTWTGRYEDVLPYVRDAFGRVIEQFRSNIPLPIREDLVQIVRELCDPDPRLRGHPRNRNQPALQYSVQRYIARFDLLARRAEGGFVT